VVEPREVADASPLVASADPSPDRLVEQRRFLEQVWNELVQLPVRQRVALLLNLRDANGAGILWLLPVAGIATIRQIASVLEMPEIELARMWREIPLDDLAIGGRLGCTRQQVINLRMSARKRLLNRVGRWRESALRSQSTRVNLRPVSASLKGRA
jgi:hypothetical protein